MKKILSALCIAGLLAFLVTETQAQDTRFGIKGGLTFYKIASELSVDIMGFSESESYDSDMKMGFHGGIFMEKPFNEYLSIQPEVNFIQKGGSESNESGEFADFSDEDVTLSYIDVPLLLKANIPLEGSVSPFVTAGGYAGYLLDVSIDGVEDDIKDEINDFSYGLLFGAGVTFGNIFIEARYDYGLSNLIDDDLFMDELGEFDDIGDFGFDLKVRNKGFNITVGFIF